MNRDSNMEMIRIIAMSMIVCGHFLGYGGIIEQFDSARLIYPLFLGGVDLFILISGYYRIKINWNSIIKLGLIVVFYRLLNIVICCIFDDFVGLGYILRAIFAPFSSSGYWFINIYFALMILSPLINKGLDNFDSKQLKTLMILLSIVEFYSCFIIGSRIEAKGYQLFNFIYLYLLGYYIRKNDFFKSIKESHIKLIFVTSLIINILLMYISLCFPERNDLYDAVRKYSNPFLISMDCSIIVFFSRHSFKSVVINSVAAASLGVYMLQDGLIGSHIIYPFQRSLLSQENYFSFFIVCIVLFIGYWISAWIINSLLTALLPNISKYFANKLAKIANIEFK